MNERKNIERLFQEKFKDFEVEPSEKVWKNIESKLKEKKEEREVMPLWLKLSGIAATLLVGFFTTEYVLNVKKENDPRIVIEDTNHPGKTESNPTVNTGSIITSAEAANTNTATEKTSSDNALENGTISSEVSANGNNQNINATNQPVVQSEISKNKTEKNNRVNTSGKMRNNATVADGDTKKDTKSKTLLKKNAKGKNNSLSPLKYNTNTAIVMHDAEKNSKKNSKKKGFKNKKNNSSSIAAVSQSNTTKQIKNNVPLDSDTRAANQNSAEKPSSESNPLVASNQVAVLKDTEIKKTDSTAIAVIAPNALEELLKEKQKEATATTKTSKPKKWDITSNVGSIYYGSLSNGSPLDTLFKNNAKEYKTNLAYGLGVKYALDTKFSVRTGVNAVALEYSTNDVVFYQNKNAVSIQHVKNNLQGSLIQVESKHAPTETPQVTKFDGNLNQKTGYIEVPLELSYKIMDKKFGIEVIGGLSTLFLNENKVSLISSGMNMDIGKADNLNKLHFSTNIGLGLKYNFYKSFQINFDPMFKYQLNTYNDDSGDFKPYFFGLYTGISFRF